MKVGKHEMEIEEPDFIALRVRGKITVPETEVLAKALVQHRRGDTVYLVSVIETSSFEMPGDARRAFVESLSGIATVVNAVVGGSFHVRVIGRLVASAARVLSGTTLRLDFFDDERSARAWLCEQGCVACRASMAPDERKS